MPDLSAFVPKGMSLQRTFNSSGTQTVDFGANFTIYDHAQQSDGKIIIGGNFYAYNNASAGSINRIETNGELDTAFNTNIGTGPEGNSTSRDVYAVAIQPDGKILVSGLFDGFNGVTQQGLVRLNSNGTPDTAFNANVANLFDRSSGDTYAYSIALQSDGKIILGGFWNNGLYDSALTLYNIFYLARLNSDGTIDTTFSSNGTTYPTLGVFKVVVQSDDKILVGGSFTTFNTSGGSVSVSGLARLNANGTLDTTFNTALGTGINTGAVRALALQSDGSIIFGGDFTSFNGTTCDIARVSSTGTFDTSFNTNVGTGIAPGEYIFSISVQSDGDILVGGAFAAWNGTTVGDIVRLNSDGTRDTAFTTANGTGSNSAYGQIRTLSQLASGDILVAGDSLSKWNGETVNNILTLTSAGAKTTTFLPQPDVVFAVVVGGGGRGGSQTTYAGGGGASGAVVWGMVPASTSVVVGRGATAALASTDSFYSTLYASAGDNGSSAIAGSNGSAGTGASVIFTVGDASTTIGGAASVLFTSIGGAGGGYVKSGVANATGLPGSPGTSGGGGGIAITTGANAFSATAGAGGSGIVGGGGAGAACTNASSTGSATGGAGGGGFYAGGTASTITGTGAKYASGGGGGGLLGAGGNGATGTSSAIGGAGGLGGGGGGGGVNGISTTHAGPGGGGCVLLYW
jgi:uncharacterized delta-60 repeat protein